MRAGRWVGGVGGVIEGAEGSAEVYPLIDEELHANNRPGHILCNKRDLLPDRDRFSRNCERAN
jgi:hypothetical protein